MAVNLLELVPVKIVQSEESQDGKVIILKPKFKYNFFLKYVLPKMKHPYYKVDLDEFGSFVWKQIDGKQTVKEIGLRLKENFKEKVDPVYDRLSEYIHSLVRAEFIQFKDFDIKKSEKSNA